MKKWERRVYLTIAELGAKVVERKKIGGHARLIIQLPSGAKHKLVVSSSPAIPEHALVAVRRDVLQLINQPAPKGTS